MNSDYFKTELITSKSNSTIVEIAKLNDKKYRDLTKRFICDGVKLFLECVEYGANIGYVILNDNAEFDNFTLEKIRSIRDSGAKILCVTDSVFSKLTSEKAPQGIITVCDFLSEKHRYFTNAENIYDGEKVMLFESVRDPGNLGTIIRCAAAFGLDRIIISSDCADIYSPKVMRSAMGAIFKVGIDIIDDFSSAIKILRASGKRVLASMLGTRSLILGKDAVSESDVIVLGNEGHGISDKTAALCDDSVFIPMRANTESLNVSMAAGIFMWELFG